MMSVPFAFGLAHHLSMLRNSDAAHSRGLEEILSGIHYFRAHDHMELVALVKTLPQFLATHQKVKIVICDSIAAAWVASAGPLPTIPDRTSPAERPVAPFVAS